MFQVALEQLVPREQRVIADPVAYPLLPAGFKRVVELCQIEILRKTLLNLVDRQVPGIHGGILCRKRYIEDKLRSALEAGFQQVVILGAGFDTLAYRVAELASRQVYEVDLPEIIQAKQVDLERTFGRIPAHEKLVPIDFNHQEVKDVLERAGYTGEGRTFFVWEGVTQYIPEAAVRKVFKFFSQAAPESQLVFTYIRKDFIEGKQMYGLKVLYDQAVVRQKFWLFGLDPASVPDFLREYAWREVEQVGNKEYQQRYLKPTNRKLLVMEVERAVHAEKTSPP